MSKELAYIGLCVGFDGPTALPGKSNMISLTGYGPGNMTFNQNILPQSGRYKESTFWDAHPKEFAELKKDRTDLESALMRFNTWLRNFQARLVPCCGAIDYWFLTWAYSEQDRKFPFTFNSPYDTQTLRGINVGENCPKRGNELINPLKVVEDRYLLATQGKVQRFGKKPKKEITYNRFAAQGGGLQGAQERLQRELDRARNQAIEHALNAALPPRGEGGWA